MEKQIYCLIHPRRKVIKFTSKENLTDTEILRDLLNKACKTDKILSMMLKDKAIIFQVKDESGVWCDMDEEKQIPDKTEINCLLISLPPIETTNILLDPSNLKFGDKVELDLNVVYAEASTNALNAINVPPSTSEFSSNSSESQSDVNLGSILAYSADENTGESDLHESAKSIEVKKDIKKCVKPLMKLPKLSVLPELSFDLKNKIEKNGILQSQHHLIRFWGQYLVQETAEQPSKQDYYNLASTIVFAYPELQGGNNGNGIVRTQLSSWVRNHRSLDKKSLKRKRQACDYESEASTSSYKKVSIGTASTALEMVTESDITRANEELKKFVKGKNEEHFKRLLSVTETSRRSWIENESTCIAEIIEKYPPFAYYETIIHECIKIILRADESIVFSDIENVLTELFTYFTNEENEDYINLKVASEKNKSTVIYEICKMFLPKRLKKTTSHPLWELHQTMDSLDCLSFAQGAAPRAILFINEEAGTIDQAFIIADENVQVEVPEPTTAKILALLLSAYYPWHRSFPPAYIIALDFFAFKMFKSECKKNNVVAKFIRRLDNFQVNLKSKENIDSNILQ